MSDAVQHSSNDPDSIDHALERCREHARAEGILLGEMLQDLGRSSFCFAAFVLAVPLVQPFSLGPLSMMAGLGMVVIGWQMGRGREKPALPAASAKLRIHGKGWTAVLTFCQRLLGFCRRFTRRRWPAVLEGERGERFIGWLILIGGALIAVPVANLPFNNSLPALMVVFACIGWLERDAVMIVISIAWGVVTLVYFAAVVFCVVFFGAQAWAWIEHFSVFR